MSTLPVLKPAPTTVMPLDVRRRSAAAVHGIEVHEEQLASIAAQLLYRMRCECGRGWFDLELPKIVECPACGKIGVVVL